MEGAVVLQEPLDLHDELRLEPRLSSVRLGQSRARVHVPPHPTKLLTLEVHAVLRVVPVYLLLGADEAVPSVLEPLQERPRQIRVARGVRVSFVLVGGIPKGALVEVPEALLDEPNLVAVRPPHSFLGVPEVLVLH